MYYLDFMEMQAREGERGSTMRRIRQVVGLMVVFVVASTFAAQTYTQKVNGITWTYIVTNGYASVGSGEYNWRTGVAITAVPTSTVGAITIPSSLGGYPVKDIEDYAFYKCGKLTGVTIPNGVANIGYFAFKYCDSLGSVSMPNTLTSIKDDVFGGCTNLTSVTIPVGVKSIGQYAFSSCKRLTSVTIPNSVTNIGYSAFAFCHGLASITLPFVGVHRGNTDTKESLFGHIFGQSPSDTGIKVKQYYTPSSAVENYIPASLRSVVITDETELGHGAFYGCYMLTNVIIPNSVTNIASYAFYGCSGLTSMIIPDGVQSISSNMFNGCLRLNGVVMPDSISTIESYAFNGCTNLTNIAIPGGVKNIGDSVFQSCSGMTSIVIPDGVISIGSSSFSGCWRLESITMPSGMTNIGTNMFYGCYSLTNVTIPDVVTNIGNYAFANCIGLTSVTIGNSVADIGSSAFRDCRGLANVTIPDSVTNVGDSAFYGCNGLTTVVIGKGVANIGSRSFSGCNAIRDVAINQCVCSSKLSSVFPSSCSTITNVVIFDDVASVGDSAFSDCSGLMSVTIPDSVTSIGSSAFSRCSGLTSVTIPDSVTSLGSSAFNACGLMDRIIFDGDAPLLGSGVFRGISDQCHIFVSRNSMGWDTAIPGEWNGLPIDYKSYIVSFDARGGVLPEAERMIDYGDSIGELPIPTKEHCSFDGWFTLPVGGEEVQPSNLALGDIALYAHWIVDQYRVAYNFGEGDIWWRCPAVGVYRSTQSSFSIMQDYDLPTVIPNVYRTGYTFQGWEPEVAATVPAEDVEYTAQWSINSYNITFNANGGVGGMSTNLEYGTTLIAPVVSRIGYIFNHWEPDVPATVPAQNITCLAQWTPIKYTVTFDANGGQDGITGEVDYDSELVAPEVSREGYTFLGWTPEVAAKVPLGGATYTAQWQINQYEVVFDANGGDGGTCTNLDYGTEIVAPTITRTGYSFCGWSPSVDETVPACDVTYAAQWTPNKYIVTFDANGGEGGISEDLDFESAISAPIVTRNGYTLKGWSPSLDETVPLGGATYTAQWEINQYTVTFDANGGVGGMSGKQDYGTAIVVPTVTREGYTFQGWLPEIPATVPEGDVTYTAQWEINKYTVVFDANGGDGGASLLYEHGESLPMPTAPTRDKYNFVGWFTAAEGGEAFIFENAVVTSAMTLYAHWEMKQNTWFYDVEKGKATITKYSTTDSDITIPSELDGYPVAVIAGEAFENCTNSTSIVVPTSVTSIGAGAFNGCCRLKTITLPFVGSARRNSGVSNALFGYIFGESAYMGGTSTKQYYSSASYSTFYIPSALRQVIITDESLFGYGAFSYCSGLTNITFGSTLTSIGPAAFRSCGGLTSMTIPSSVTSIGNQAFDGCSKLANVYVDDVAAWCKISFGNYYSNPLVYANKFYLNGRLVTNLEIPNSVTSIGAYAFCKCSGLTRVTIPDTVTRIGAYAFRNCTGLTGMTIPNSVTIIGNDAFYSCSKLVSVEIGDSVTSIGANAFENCSKLASVTIPGLVTYIGSSAFCNCGGLTNVVFRGDAPTMGSGAFNNVDIDCCVYVRRASSGWGVEIPGIWQGMLIDYVRRNVAFDADGGNCEVANACVVDGSAIGELPTPTRWGYTFKGWWTAHDGGEEVTGETMIEEDLTLYAHWGRHIVAAPEITPVDGSAFYGDLCKVTIICATDGALIYYSDDGATPKIDDDYLYDAPFTINDTTVIKAVAVFEGVRSDYVTVTITKEDKSLNAVLDAPDSVTIASDPAVPWQSVANDAAKVGGSSARSGAIGNRTNTWLSATVEGAGTMIFWCKVSCEHDEDNMFTWDRLMIYTNDVEIVEWRMDGETDWTERTLSFDGGTNTVKWVYYKDRTGADGEDCSWIDAVTWTPSEAADPIPAVAVDADTATVNAAVDGAGFVDAAVKVAIWGSATEYNKFKTWADGVKGVTGDALAGEAAVVANAHAAVAYLLGAERLFENEPTVEIGELAIVDGESAGTTAMTVAVTVKDGESAVAVSVANVAAMFEATSDLGDWDGAAKLTPTVTTSGTDASGKMTFVVTPGDGTANRAFLRIKR